MNIDLLVVNAVIAPMTDRDARFGAMAVAGERIAWLGDDPPPALREAAAHVYDAQGRWVLPGFVDAHQHFGLAAFFATGPDLRFAADWAAVRRVVDAYAPGRRRIKVVTGWGLSPALAGNLDDDAHALARALAAHRRGLFLVVAGADRAVVNAALVRRLKLSIDHGEEDIFVLAGESFVGAAARLGKALGRRWLWTGFDEVTHQLVRHGITAVHSIEGAPFPDARMPSRIDRIRWTLPVHLLAWPQVRDPAALRKGKRCAAVVLTDEDAADPVLGSFVREAGADAGVRHLRPALFATDEDVRAWVWEAHRRGMQLLLGTPGPRAVDLALDAIEAAMARLPRVDARHRLDAVLALRREQIERMAQLGVNACVLPGVLAYHPELARHTADTDTNLVRMPLRSLLRAGVALGAGSDAPAGTSDVVAAVRIMRNHPALRERLDAWEAWRAWTAGAARLAFQEDDRGTLALGRRADFVVLDADPFGPSDVPVQVSDVFLGGRRYERRSMGMGRYVLGVIEGSVRARLGADG